LLPTEKVIGFRVFHHPLQYNDRMVYRRWFGGFTLQFKRITGKALDHFFNIKVGHARNQFVSDVWNSIQLEDALLSVALLSGVTSFD
jgi:hypothetical protein